MEPAPTPAPEVADRSRSLPLNAPLRVPTAAAPSTGVQWSHALPGAALGGAFSLLAAIIPYAIFGPAFIAGGVVSVMLYRRHLKSQLPTPGAGGQVGAASGAFGFLFFAIPAVATLVYRPDELRRGLLDSVSQLIGRGYDPQRVQQVQELLKTPQGLTFFVAFCLFVMFLMFVVGSSIGGALYAAWLRKRTTL